MASAYATTNGSYAAQEQNNAAAGGSQHAENGSSTDRPDSVDKDQVGWYFVERYYSILSEKPDQLHLFYNTKSQFIYGKEAEILPVLVGRKAIQSKIGELDLCGSKIRIANVDAQATEGDNIVVQVIGEIFNHNTNELLKFTQTFVLAKQHNGYYVLNDIFRSHKAAEEDQEAAAVEEDAPADAEEPAPKVEESKAEPVEEPKAAGLDADVVDKKLESAMASESAPEAPVTNGNGVTAEADKAEEAPVAATKPDVSLTPEVAEKEVEEEAVKEIETPKDPSPTPAPVAAPPKAKPVAPVQPAAPVKKSWAQLASGAATTAKPAPAVPTKPATPPVQPRAAAAPSAPAVAAPASATAAPTKPSQAAPANSEPAEKESASQTQGWQTAGSDQKRQPRPQSVSSPAGKDDTLGYVRNVSEKVDVQELKSALAKYGELVYFDVNRGKNCAFVEFATAAGYNAAVAANPHVLAGEHISVEPRRPKAAPYGGSGYNNNNRGAMNNRGRGNFEGRTGSQGGGRGGFQQRGRGAPSGGAPRGNAQRTTAV